MTKVECERIIEYLTNEIDVGNIAGGASDPKEPGYSVEDVHAVLRLFVTDSPEFKSEGLEMLNRKYRCDMSPAD